MTGGLSPLSPKVRNRLNYAYKNSNKKKLQEVISELRDIHANDIIKTINDSFEQKIISKKDHFQLLALTDTLLDYLYAKYRDEKEVDNMFRDRSLTLSIDPYIDALDEKDEEIARKDAIIAEKDNAIAEKDNAIAEKDKIIENLQKQLEVAKK